MVDYSWPRLLPVFVSENAVFLTRRRGAKRSFLGDGSGSSSPRLLPESEPGRKRRDRNPETAPEASGIQALMMPLHNAG